MTSQHDEHDPVVDPAALVSTTTAARLAGCTVSYIRRMCRDGRIDGAVHDEDGKWMVPAAWAAQRDSTDESVDHTWELERDLLYAERTSLKLRLLEQQVESLRRERDAAMADNARLRAALTAVVAPVDPPLGS